MAIEGTKGDILIIDDEPTWRRFSETTLIDDGYRVATVGALHEALELLLGDCYDLVVVNADFLQPEEREILATIVSRCENKRLVVMSEPFTSRTRALSESRTAFKLGADEWISKPLGRRSLLDTIEFLITGQRQRVPQT